MIHTGLIGSALALCLGASAALATSETARFDPDLIVLEQGIYCSVEPTGETPAPDTLAGIIELIDAPPEFRWIGTRVPAVPGISFGVRTQTVNAELLDNVLVTLTHPRFTRSGLTRQTYTTMLGGAGRSLNAYGFDVAEELVTGTWTFTATHDGQEVYSAQFEVVPASAEPGIAAGCGTAPLS